MKSTYLLTLGTMAFFLISSATAISQNGEEGPAHSYLNNYYSMLNNMGDSGFSISEKKLFRAEILDQYFIKDESLVFNDLNAEGSVVLKAEEYLNNIVVGHDDISFLHKVINVGELDISRSPMKMTCMVEQKVKEKSKKDITTRLEFVIEIYNLSNDGSLYGRIKSIDLDEKEKQKRIAEVADSDGDGIRDINDKCPELKGKKTNLGCPDSDNDGIIDPNDACPTIPGVARHDGCPVPDSDSDGINDEQDECPNFAGTLNGCPDSDGDGIKDSEDNCPNTKGNVNGCPENESIPGSSQIAAQENASNNKNFQKQDSSALQTKRSDIQDKPINVIKPNGGNKFLLGISYGLYTEKGLLSGDGGSRVYDPNTISLELAYSLSPKLFLTSQIGVNLDLGNHLQMGFGVMSPISTFLDLGVSYLNKKTFAYDTSSSTGYSARAGGLQAEVGVRLQSARLSGAYGFFPSSAIGTVEAGHSGLEIGIGYIF